MDKKRNSRLYLLILNGLIAAFGPFVTDFYLPALPELGEYFHSPASVVQLSLTFGLVGLAVGQLIVGPLSDKFGRKKPLLYSMILFCLSTIGCLYSVNVGWFIFFRLIQGLSGAGGVVISRSIATDLYEGKELTMFFTMLSAVQGLAPILAPVFGGLLLGVTNWEGIFYALLGIGVVILLALLFFRESLPVAKRKHVGVFASFASFVPLVRNLRFMRFVLVQAFAMGVMFTYIAASPFIFQETLGLTAIEYGICFGANAFAIMLGSFTVALFPNALKAMRVGSLGFFLLSLLVGLALFLYPTVWSIEGLLFVMLYMMGLILPSSTALALNIERENSGSASALLGFLMFLFGGVLSPLTGIGNMLHTTAILIALCSLGALLCSFAHRR